MDPSNTNVSFDKMKKLLVEGKNDELKSILNQNLSFLNLEDMRNRTLLHIATTYNNFIIAEYLINLGCNVDAKDMFGCTSLMIATAQGEYRIMESLLKANADIFIANLIGMSALRLFLNQPNISHLHILDMFFEKVKSRSTSNEDLFKILVNAECRLDIIVHLRNAEVTRMFLEQQSNIHSAVAHRSVYNCMVLLYEENLRLLLQYGGDVEQMRTIFLELFYYLASQRRFNEKKMAKMFIELLIELKFLDEYASNFVDILIMTVTEESLGVIIKSDINSYVESRFGYEPIAYIFGNSRTGVFNLIKSQVRWINALGQSKFTGLHIAASRGVVRNVEYLLEMGVNPNAITESGRTPLFYMNEDPDRRKKCVRLLLQHGADLQAFNYSGKCIFNDVGPIDKYLDTWKILLNHLAILKVKGVPIKDQIVAHVNSHEQLITRYEKSCKQLEEMKTHKVCGSLNLFKVLTTSVDYTSHCVGSLDEETFKALFQSDRFQSYDSYYTTTLCERIIKAMIMHKYRKRAMAALCDAVEMLKPYYVVVDKICSFLNEDDLYVFR